MGCFGLTVLNMRSSSALCAMHRMHTALASGVTMKRWMCCYDLYEREQRKKQNQFQGLMEWYMSAPFHKGRKSYHGPPTPSFLVLDPYSMLLYCPFSFKTSSPTPSTETWNMGFYLTKVDNLM
ncbi:hypothetical protein LOK49_LG07G03636 [Camellia lanceoleosa]|uniref:Uncharacterized protein n=1 Tax=Camellia lanceoleosa TaxID=1840588 RepID=A0ACC0GYB6_9ERIC|nr:hypothetical protein LOK49_LG07G03636 [Camellia lanceoleosa]